jgi:hypothetical protein
LNSELNIERWNYFITLKYVRDPKNLVLALHHLHHPRLAAHRKA